MKRRLGVTVGASMERLMGRGNLVRVSRFLLDYARRDVPNRMSSNGEWMVQDVILAASTSDPVVVFDVGAHVGAWSKRLPEVAVAR